MDNYLRGGVFLPKKPPYELTGEYLDSKALTGQLYRLHCGDSIRECNAKNTNYFARKELCSTEKRLQSKRRAAARTWKQLDTEWDNLRKKEKELRDTFIEFNAFVLGNFNKRGKASKDISKLEQVVQKRTQEIESMELRNKELTAVKATMHAKIDQFKLYEDYLDAVVKNYPLDFQKVYDVLSRYDLLRLTNHELAKNQAVQVLKMEQIKQECAKTLERYSVQVTGLNTRVALLQQRYDDARRRCRLREELYERIRAGAMEQLVDVTSVKESCGCMYGEICERKGAAPVHGDDYVKQLEVIKATLRDYRRINDLARKAERERRYVSERPRASQQTD